jgi:hypothetical protein
MVALVMAEVLGAMMVAEGIVNRLPQQTSQIEDQTESKSGLKYS